MINKMPFSSTIPTLVQEDILSKGTENSFCHVYRVAKYGELNEVTFLNSFEESIYENRKPKIDISNIVGSFSTSCYLSIFVPKKFMNFLKARYRKKYPKVQIIEGYTVCGLSQLTCERIPDYPEKDHVDWWIYKDSLNEVANRFTFIEDGGE